MRKKIVTFLLAGVLLGAAACSKNTPSDAKPTKEPAATPTPGITQTLDITPILNTDQKPTETPNPTEAPNPTETPNPTKAPEPTKAAANSVKLEKLPLVLWNEYDSKYDDEQLVAYSSTPQVALAKEGTAKYPKLAEALQQANRDAMAVRRGFLAHLIETGEGGRPEEMDFGPLFVKSEINLVRTDEVILSYYEDYSDYTGGAHGYYSNLGVNYRTADGKRLELGDVVTDLEKFKKILAAATTEKYADRIMFDVKEHLDTCFTETDANLSWVVGYDGLTVYYNPYEIASFADGILDVTIPFAGNEGLFASEYQKKATTYVMQCSTNLPIMIDWNGDGNREAAYVSAAMDEEEFYQDITIRCSGQELKAYNYSIGFDVYLVHAEDGKEYIYAVCEGFDISYDIVIFGMENGKIANMDMVYCSGFAAEKSDEEDGYYGVIAFTDPTCVYINHIVDIIGTRFSICKYYVNQYGILVREKDTYDLVSDYENVVIKDFEAIEVKTGNVVEISAGSLCRGVSTDGETYIIMEIAGEEYRIEVDTSEWPCTINGVDESEIFADIVYAG